MELIATICLFLACANLGSCEDKEQSKESAKSPTSAVLRSQGGCLLKARPGVKEFLKKDIQFFDNVTYERKRNPQTALDERSEVFFLDDDDEILEHFYLERLRRHEINKLFLDRGFIKNEGGQTIQEIKEEEKQHKAKREKYIEEWKLKTEKEKQKNNKESVVIPRIKVEL